VTVSSKKHLLNLYYVRDLFPSTSYTSSGSRKIPGLWVPVETNEIVRRDVLDTMRRFNLALWLQLQKRLLAPGDGTS